MALPFCGEIDECVSFMAEIASLACPNKLAFLEEVNLSTESDIDVAINLVDFNSNWSLTKQRIGDVDNSFAHNCKNNYELLQ